MKIEIEIDEHCIEPKIIVVTDKITDEINMMVKSLSQESPKLLVGFKNSVATVLDIANIYKIYSSSGKVFAVTNDEEYLLKMRLYEFEDKFKNAQMVRISNSEVINFKKVKRFDMGLTGTICVEFINGTQTYASRRYVSKLKEILGI